MEHLTLKAVATTTDQGIFRAVISPESVDREKDVVSASAMVAALKKWNRPLPLAWEHSTKAENIFGSIDPQSAREVAGEVVVDGRVDLESAVGAEAWRSFKARTLGFSFGYLTVKETPRADGGRDISELDVYEISASRTPMNNSTRVLSTKAVADAGLPRYVEQLIDSPIGFFDGTDAHEQAKALARPSVEELKERCRRAGIDVPEPASKSVKPARKAAPAIKIASFEC